MVTSELNFGHMSPSGRARESVKTSYDAMHIFVYFLFTKTGNLALVFLHKSRNGVKIVAPPKRLVVTSLLQPPCDVKFLPKFPITNFPNFLKITSARKSVSFDALISFALHSDLWQVMVEREFYCFGATDKCHNGQSGQENRLGLLSWFSFCQLYCISNYFL